MSGPCATCRYMVPTPSKVWIHCEWQHVAKLPYWMVPEGNTVEAVTDCPAWQPKGEGE